MAAHIKSPLNYVGGKFKIIDQILPIFPPKIGRFVDLFCGGLNVSLNTKGERYLANDTCDQLISLYKFLKENNDIIAEIHDVIDRYGISITNQEGYLSLRRDYNEDKNPIKLFVLITNSFNHQFRFNSKQEFNMPFGKNRSFFNEAISKNLENLLKFLKESTIEFTNLDFRKVPIEEGDFVYCDPPYSLTTAVYNAAWSPSDDLDLVNLLDQLNIRGIKFALSCILNNGEKDNAMLREWAKKYKTTQIEWKFRNSYHKINKTKGEEVCITNYLLFR